MVQSFIIINYIVEHQILKSHHSQSVRIHVLFIQEEHGLNNTRILVSLHVDIKISSFNQQISVQILQHLSVENMKALFQVYTDFRVAVIKRNYKQKKKVSLKKLLVYCDEQSVSRET